MNLPCGCVYDTRTMLVHNAPACGKCLDHCPCPKSPDAAALYQQWKESVAAIHNVLESIGRLEETPTYKRTGLLDRPAFL
jgi:hypothetical protein